MSKSEKKIVSLVSRNRPKQPLSLHGQVDCRGISPLAAFDMPHPEPGAVRDPVDGGDERHSGHPCSMVTGQQWPGFSHPPAPFGRMYSFMGWMRSPGSIFRKKKGMRGPGRPHWYTLLLMSGIPCADRPPINSSESRKCAAPGDHGPPDSVMTVGLVCQDPLNRCCRAGDSRPVKGLCQIIIFHIGIKNFYFSSIYS